MIWLSFSFYIHLALTASDAAFPSRIKRQLKRRLQTAHIPLFDINTVSRTVANLQTPVNIQDSRIFSVVSTGRQAVMELIQAVIRQALPVVFHGHEQTGFLQL